MWFIISIVLCIMLIISLVYHIIYRRQVEGLSRQTAFLNEKKTELKINTDLNAKELKSLAAEIRKLNDNFNETKINLMKQDAALRETITNLSHDIRTPLTSLDGYFQLLASEKTDQAKKEYYLGIIRNRIESLNSMLDELFTYAKLQDINYSIELSELDITAVTADILMSFYDELTERCEEPVVILPEEPVLIKGNKEAYTRVVQNIIRNALIHGRNIKVSLKREGTDVIFDCSDELLNPDTIIDTSRIFDRFYKADKARTNAKGSGLGLAISKELVERMDGRISAECNDGIFTIRIVF